MAKLDQPGYPLPSGELGDDEIVCQLVYLPDRAEYWQALFGALHYMTTWRAWERDVDKRGKDAAANWRDAFELTIGCWRMTCLETIEELLEILVAHQNDCCHESDITDGAFFTDEVEDGTGDVPANIVSAGYASGSSDWSGFDDYKCMIAHVTVDVLEARLRKLATLVDSSGLIIGGVATIATIITTVFTGGLTAIALGFIAVTGATAALYALLSDGSILEGIADDVATNHDDLACAIYFADGSDLAITDLNTAIDALFSAATALILKNMNLGPTVKALYSGRYDEQNVAQILADNDYDLLDFDCAVCDGDIPLPSQVRGIHITIIANSGFGDLRAIKPYGFKKSGSGDWFMDEDVGKTNALSTTEGLSKVVADNENSTVGSPTDFVGLRLWHFDSGSGNFIQFRVDKMYELSSTSWRNVKAVSIKSGTGAVVVNHNEIQWTADYLDEIEFECYW